MQRERWVSTQASLDSSILDLVVCDGLKQKGQSCVPGLCRGGPVLGRAFCSCHMRGRALGALAPQSAGYLPVPRQQLLMMLMMVTKVSVTIHHHHQQRARFQNWPPLLQSESGPDDEDDDGDVDESLFPIPSSTSPCPAGFSGPTLSPSVVISSEPALTSLSPNTPGVGCECIYRMEQHEVPSVVVVVFIGTQF